MILKVKGNTASVPQVIVAPVTRKPEPAKEKIFLADNAWPGCPDHYKATAGCSSDITGLSIPAIGGIASLDHLTENDIVAIHPDGLIQTLYRPGSCHNFLFFTERCNSNCLMCSQPPRDRDDTAYFYDLYQQLIPLIPKDCAELGITGGEPTLLGNRFFHLLHLLQEELPETELHCLTNGRSFAWPNVAARLGNMQYNRLMLGIPLYADVYHIHDYIVQAKDAFYQTMEGLYQLAGYGQRLEIRIVLHQLTIPRLVKLARYIYKNLPFVEHVAFMGLEHQGYTPFNIDKLWIDPFHYRSELSEAVTLLDGYGMNVSIYNAPLCTLPEELWKYARKSISDWKNVYLPECSQCAAAPQCGGLFASGLKKHSDYIKAIRTPMTG